MEIASGKQEIADIVSFLSHAGFLLDLLLNPEDRSCIFL
jgi:hypothetical protein